MAAAVAAAVVSSTEGVVAAGVTPVANNPPTIAVAAEAAESFPIAVAVACWPVPSAADEPRAADATVVSTTTAEALADACVCSAAVAVRAVTRVVTRVAIRVAAAVDASPDFVVASLVTAAAIPNPPVIQVATPVVAADVSLASVADLATADAATPSLLVTPDAIRVVAAVAVCFPGFEADVRLEAVAIPAKIVPEPIPVILVLAKAYVADWLLAAANWARDVAADVTPDAIRVAETQVVAADAERLSLLKKLLKPSQQLLKAPPLRSTPPLIQVPSSSVAVNTHGTNDRLPPQNVRPLFNGQTPPGKASTYQAI